MIKLELSKKPKKLTAKLTKELTAEFTKSEKSVWNRKFIRDAVLEFSHGKCCYSECKLDEESKYMEVDHFYPKKHFPGKVVEWGNLLASSKKCNTTKGELDTSKVAIINPLVDDPKTHLYIENFRFYHKTQLGRNTIDYTALNDRKHFVNKRYKIGIKAIEILEDLQLNFNRCFKDISSHHGELVRLITKYKGLLQESSRTEEYSATISTVILTNSSNDEIESELRNNKMWDKELDSLRDELVFCSLIKP